jgi:carbonic anhydrase/acetyltransferase-like protein (isoleucine patch superfamily)
MASSLAAARSRGDAKYWPAQTPRFEAASTSLLLAATLITPVFRIVGRFYTWFGCWKRLWLFAMNIEDLLAQYCDQTPAVDETVYVAKGAVVIGAVTLAPHASVWHGAVLRGDINTITVGEGSNVQDGTIVHLSDDYGVKVGDYVTIGHAAMIHACEIGDGCLIGMKATILDGAVIGAESIVGAGALVTKGKQFPAGSLILGAPAKVVRALTPEERASGRELAEKYVRVAAGHKARFGSEL